MLKRIIASIGTLLVLVCCAFTLWFAALSPYQTRIVHTGSMGNTIPSGSAVIVHEGVYKIGQPTTFVANGQVVTHRLISIDASGNITTKGDANASVDPTHPPKSNIIGGVVAAPRHLGWWLQYLHQPSGLLSLVSLIAALMLIWPVKQEQDAQASST